MTNRQATLLDQIESAVRELRKATEDNDSKETIDWGLTVQIATADLAATVITQVRNV